MGTEKYKFNVPVRCIPAVRAGHHGIIPFFAAHFAVQVNEEQFAGQKDDIGTEIELFVNWKLAQGLVYGVEAAYLFTGDAWVGTTGPAPSDVLVTDTDNVFFLRHRLELTW